MKFLIILFPLLFTALSSARSSERVEQIYNFIDRVVFGYEAEAFAETASTQRDNSFVTRVQGQYTHQLNSFSYIDTQARFSFITRGTIQAINYLIPERQQGGLEPLSLYLGLGTPSEYLNQLPASLRKTQPQLKLGVINQNFLDAPLLISDWGFMGLQQEFSLSSLFKTYVDEAKIVFQQTLPSSVVENINYISQIQKQAYFLTGSLFLKHNYKDIILSKGSLTAFNFMNLSSEVAEKGRSLGNIIQANATGADSRFEYPFYGGHLNVGTYIYLFEELDLEIEGSFLWNIGEFRKLTNYDNYIETVFSDESKSYSLAIRLHIPFLNFLSLGNNIEFIPSYEYFVSAPQASPAYYNSHRYGYSNRSGHVLGSKFLFEKDYFLNIEYRVFQKIANDQRDAIGDLNYFSLTIGRDYSGKI